jgi:hypothetical protein
MHRRHFLKTQAIMLAAALTGKAQMPATSSRVLSGMQIGPYDPLDEGIEACLDFLQEHGAINALFCYSQTYHLGESPVNVLATDHPCPPKNPAGRVLPFQWVDLPEQPFAGLRVRHERRRPQAEYAGRDVFAELAEPCRKRGIKLYARILEAGMSRADRIPGYAEVASLNLDGRPADGPCWNHPDYREWIRLTVQETLRKYPLDGLQYGAERVGVLSEILFKGNSPSCFCPFCQERNRSKGIDVKRAIAGYRLLHDLMRGVAAGGAKPVDGVMTEVLRVCFQYPEVLAYYREWLQADTEIHQMVYKTAKAVRPSAEVGQHVDHQRSSWDILYRAAVSYGDMAGHNDFIKPILYHEIMGPRLQEWVVDEMQKRVLADLSKEQALGLFYGIFGHDPSHEPSYANLSHSGLSPEYVYRETLRCVKGVAGRAKVYAGIGLDVPHYVPGGMKPMPSDPESVQAATSRALEAGAQGVLASREYREIRRPSLQAFGRAVRQWSR